MNRNSEVPHRDRIVHPVQTSPNDKSTDVYDRANALFKQYMSGGQLDDLDNAISLHRTALGLRSGSHPRQYRSLHDLAIALSTRFSQRRRPEDLKEATTFYRRTLELPLPSSIDRPKVLSNLAIALSQSDRREDLTKAISLHRQVLEPLSVSDPFRAISLKNLSSALDKLSSALWTHFEKEKSGRRKDLNEVISLRQESLGLLSTSDSDRNMAIYHLASAILERYEQLGQRKDLDDAISLQSQALKSSDINQPMFLVNLASALSERFRLSGAPEDLEKAISCHRKLPETHPDRIMCLNNIASALYARFDQSGEYLEETICLHRQVLGLLFASHADHSNTLTILTTVLSKRFEQSGRDEDLKEAISYLRRMRESRPYRAVSLKIIVSAISKQAERQEDFEKAISLRRQILDLLPETDPDRSFALTNLAVALSHSAQGDALDYVISLHRKALKLKTVSRHDVSISLNAFALALLTRFAQLGHGDDLEEAILWHERALKLRTAPHPERSASISNLALALLARFSHSGQPPDLETAILFHEQALKLRPPPHPERPASLRNLAFALSTRFTQLGQRDDLEKAISLQQEALKLLPTSDPYHSLCLSNLVLAESQLGRHKELKEAILLYRKAFNLLPVRDSYRSIRSMSLNNVASALWTQFELLGHYEDLKEVIYFHQQALALRPLPHPERPVSLSNLALALSTRFTRFMQLGQRDDLEKAKSLHKQALKLLPPTHPQRSTFLNNFASTLLNEFTRTDNRDDLNAAISFYRKALELRSASHPDRYMSLSNLACALWTQFARLGQRKDLEDSISFHIEALELQLDSHPHRPKSISNLALALRTQFEELRQTGALTRAISLHREALKLRPPSHPDRAISFGNLANTLWRRYEELGKPEDLMDAICLHEEALKLRPAYHPHRFVSLNNLALALWTRFTRSSEDKDLEKAILFYQEAVGLIDRSHPDRSMSLSNLALALLTRFEKFGQLVDLNKAMDYSSRSLETLVRKHPSACSCLRNKGNIYFLAYSRTEKSKYLDKAMESFEDAVNCKVAPASLRFQVAREWASHADKSKHNSALEAYQAAIELLPRLAMLSMDFTSRQKALVSGTDGLARDAAACAIRLGDYDKAVELLEAGRAVFWSQALQLRTPLTHLRAVNPGLADKLSHIALALEQVPLRDGSGCFSEDTRTILSREMEASRFRQFNDDWETAVDEVRRIEGFQDFLRRKKISSLLDVAKDTPLVILNASERGCAALILSSTGVHHVSLRPDLTTANITQLVKLILIATRRRPASARSHIKELTHQMPSLSDPLRPLKQNLERGGMGRVPQSDLIFPYVLAILWEHVVRPIIRQLHLKKSYDDIPLSTLRWCPTGQFTFLPIHAAGIYDGKEAECISDYAVSSYTPTITILLRDMPLRSAPFKMILITGPGLRHTTKEMQLIEAAAKTKMAFMKLEDGAVGQVISDLPKASIVHFACHGMQRAQPLESALVLRDQEELTVAQIYESMQQSSSNGMLAFLAACQTAMVDETLPDEVIHLGSTLLFAGFPGVVATMWDMYDGDGPNVSDTFYNHLFWGTNLHTGAPFWPDTTRAAQALHLAIAKLRKENVPFIRWVPFIHMGR